MDLWQIHLFGAMEARRGAERITRFGSRKNASLLALLAFKPGRRVLRDTAMEALWPEVEPEAGRNRLSVALNALRKLLEPPGVARGAVLMAERDALWLQAEAVTTDLAVFEAAMARSRRESHAPLRAAALDEAIAAVRGPFLFGLRDEWAEAEAGPLERRLEAVGLERARLHQRAGEGAAALDVLLRLSAAAPLSLEALEATLRAYQEAGAAPAGLAHFRAFEQRYQATFGRAVPAATRKLAAELERQGGGPQTGTARTPRVGESGPRIRAWLLAAAPEQALAEIPGVERLDEGPPVAFQLATVADADALFLAALAYDGAARAVVDVVEAGDPGAIGLRLLSVTPPGAHFLTAPAAALHARRPRGDRELRPLGTLALDPSVEAAWALVEPGAPTPAPRAGTWRRDALPAAATRFFGRADAVARIRAGWHEGVRIRTLLGQGGIGKTRLAVEAARTLLSDPEGPTEVALVSLAELRSGAALETAVREALRLPPVGPEGLFAALRHHLGDRRVLLVLDNAEHLVAEVAGFTAAALAAIPGISVLCTSQRALRVEGEVRDLIAPLPLPDPGADLATAAAHPTLALFVDRARAARPDFQLTALNVQAVLALCAHLEGSPLAIELAAARVGAWTPAQVLERLRDGEALASRQHGRPERHRSLEVAIRWNVDLLEPALRATWEELSVFAAPFNAEAAEAVCATPLAADRLVELVDAGLLVGADVEGLPLWRWLETLRSFAAAGLDDARRDRCQRAYEAWTLVGAERAYDAFALGLAATGARWFRRNWGHVRAQLEGGSIPTRVAMLHFAGHHVERASLQREMAPHHRALLDRLDGLAREEVLRFYGRALTHALNGQDGAFAAQIMARVLALIGEGPDSPARAGLLGAMASARHYAGDLALSASIQRAVLAMCERLGSPYNIGVALENLATIVGDRGDAAEARALGDRALDHLMEAGVRERLLPCRLYRALRAIAADDPGLARAELAAADAVFSEEDRPAWWIASDLARAHIALLEGNTGAARQGAEACLARFSAADQGRYIAFSLQLLSLIDLGDGRFHEALANADRAADLFRALGVWIEVRPCLPTASLAASGLGDGRLAASRAKAALALAWRMDANAGLPWMLYALAEALAPQDPARAAQALAWADRVGAERGSPLPGWRAEAVARLRARLPAARAGEGSWQRFVAEVLES